MNYNGQTYIVMAKREIERADKVGKVHPATTGWRNERPDDERNDGMTRQKTGWWDKRRDDEMKDGKTKRMTKGQTSKQSTHSYPPLTPSKYPSRNHQITLLAHPIEANGPSPPARTSRSHHRHRHHLVPHENNLRRWHAAMTQTQGRALRVRGMEHLIERAQHTRKRWSWTLRRNCGTVGLIIGGIPVCVIRYFRLARQGARGWVTKERQYREQNTTRKKSGRKWDRRRAAGEMHPVEIHQPDIHRQWHMQKRRRRRLLPSRRSWATTSQCRSIPAPFVPFRRRLLVLLLGCVVVRWDATAHDTLFILMNGAETKESVYIFMLHLFARALTSQKRFSSNGSWHRH